jgi:hypothetical protein
MTVLRLAERVTRLLGAAPGRGEPAHGGYTSAARWIVTMADGTSVFVKAAPCEQTAAWLRDEHWILPAPASPARAVGRRAPVGRSSPFPACSAITVQSEVHRGPAWVEPPEGTSRVLLRGAI